MVIFQYNLYIFGIRLWTVLYPKPCYNEPCYKEVVVYFEKKKMRAYKLRNYLQRNYPVISPRPYRQKKPNRDQSLIPLITMTYNSRLMIVLAIRNCQKWKKVQGIRLLSALFMHPSSKLGVHIAFVTFVCPSHFSCQQDLLITIELGS